MPDFAAALEPHVPSLRRYARALLRDADAADDLVHDCIARALARRRLWRRGSDLRAWLFTIMHNLHVSAGRRRGRAPATLALDDAPAIAAVRDDPAARVEALDVLRALDELPEEQRTVILLAGLEGLSYEDVAYVVGVPVGTVMSRLSRGRERLRRLTAADAPPALRRVK